MGTNNILFNKIDRDNRIDEKIVYNSQFIRYLKIHKYLNNCKLYIPPRTPIFPNKPNTVNNKQNNNNTTTLSTTPPNNKTNSKLTTSPQKNKKSIVQPHTHLPLNQSK